jgi:hypothetical protein
MPIRPFLDADSQQANHLKIFQDYQSDKSPPHESFFIRLQCGGKPDAGRENVPISFLRVATIKGRGRSLRVAKQLPIGQCEAGVTKLYEDLSNDDLIDLLLKDGSHLNKATGAEHGRRDAAAALAPDREVYQDRLMGNGGGVVAVDLLGSEGSAKTGYQPLDSVWYGEDDAELIEQLLTFYPHKVPRLILDSTVNGRRFWRGTTRPVIGLDIDRRHRPEVCADNTVMPFRSGSFDVIVYDPPHIPNQGRDCSKDFNTRFGLGTRSTKENGYSFSYTYPAFMARGVARINGRRDSVL